MSDVILYGLNPDDSKPYPIACDAGGRLRVEAFPDQHFDGNLDGNLNVTGTITSDGKIEAPQLFLEAENLGAPLKLSNTSTDPEADVNLSFSAGSPTTQGMISVGQWNGLPNYGYMEFSTLLAGTRQPRVQITAGGSLRVTPAGHTPQSTAAITLGSDGTIVASNSATFTQAQVGFTAAGELVFFSGGDRYRCVVANGVMTPQLFTREMEEQEKAEKGIVPLEL